MMRIGSGFDVHAFGEGDHVMLGGVRVPHERGLPAHSDGHVGIHSLCDPVVAPPAPGVFSPCPRLTSAFPGGRPLTGCEKQRQSCRPRCEIR